MFCGIKGESKGSKGEQREAVKIRNSNIEIRNPDPLNFTFGKILADRGSSTKSGQYRNNNFPMLQIFV